VGPRRPRPRDGLRNDAVQGEESQGNVSQRVVEDARVCWEENSVDGPNLPAARKGPFQAFGLCSRRHRDQGARVLQRR